MKKEISQFYQNVGRRVSYWLPLLFVTILAYGFSITNRTVGVDDLAYDTYYGDGKAMLAGMRWGAVLWRRAVSVLEFAPFAHRFLAAVFFMGAAAVFSCVLYRLNGHSKQIWIYTVFSAVLVTYPLINEIWEYSIVITVTGNMLLAALTMLYQMTSGADRIKKHMLCGAILAVIASSYESGMFFYVTGVMMVLFYEYCINCKENTDKIAWIKEGFEYAIPLIIGVILRFVIGKSILLIGGIKYMRTGTVAIRWNGGIRTTLFSILRGNRNLYVYNGLVYFPVTVFVVAALVFIAWLVVLSIRQRRPLPALLGVLLIISLFFQSIISGANMFYRTAQTISLFVAFIAYLVAEKSIQLQRVRLKYAALACLFMLAWHQGLYANKLLALNNQRSENDKAIVYQLGMRLKTEFDDKPVVFVGSYKNSAWIESQVTPDENTFNGKLYLKLTDSKRFVYNDVVSMWEWLFLLPRASHFGNQEMFAKYFSYCGYDIKVMPSFSRNKYNQISQMAMELNMKPFEILDCGEYIVVNIGYVSNSGQS